MDRFQQTWYQIKGNRISYLLWERKIKKKSKFWNFQKIQNSRGTYAQIFFKVQNILKPNGRSYQILWFVSHLLGIVHEMY